MSAAEQVEQETPETPEEPVETPQEPGEETPEEPAAPSEEPAETPAETAAFDEQRKVAIDKALEREHKRHERALSALYAEEWEQRGLCPLCIGEGFLVPWQPGELPSEQLDAIEALSGRYTAPEYVEDADYERCAHCEGWGRTITGAQDPEHLTKLCDKCGGNGFVKKAPNYATVTPIQPGSQEPAPTPQTPVSYGAPVNPDAWGRPAGHVHYGIEPQYVTA